MHANPCRARRMSPVAHHRLSRRSPAPLPYLRASCIMPLYPTQTSSCPLGLYLWLPPLLPCLPELDKHAVHASCRTMPHRYPAIYRTSAHLQSLAPRCRGAQQPSVPCRTVPYCAVSCSVVPLPYQHLANPPANLGTSMLRRTKSSAFMVCTTLWRWKPHVAMLRDST